MGQKFEIFWGTLCVALRKPCLIRNWTVNSDYIGQDFQAMAKGESIYCEPPGVRVQKESFREIWQLWDQYLEGEISRKDLRDLPNYHTKYVISIFHHFMECQDG